MPDVDGQISFVIGILILAIVAVVGATILTNYGDSVLTTSTLSDSETIFADNNSAQTLSQTPDTLIATTKNNSWLSFDGVNDQVYLPNSISMINNVDNYSISIWINTSDNSVGDYNTIFKMGPVSLIFINGGNVSIRVQNNSNYIFYINGSNINDSSWKNVVLTKSAWNYSLFVNGSFEISELIGDPKHSPLTSFYINDASKEIIAEMDEARVYNKTLTSTEISEIYASGRIANSSLTSEGLALWIPLNENTGTDVHSFNETDLT